MKLTITKCRAKVGNLVWRYAKKALLTAHKQCWIATGFLRSRLQKMPFEYNTARNFEFV
ncbi:MAG TPA: hypothetical protein VN857_18865 [Chthoniobacterales bacterium]|jgi:hypothetical protein|nr:hypothetical protein [Chthoniobacterales bacterium]